MLKKSLPKFLFLSLSMLFISACRGHGIVPIVTSSNSSSSFSSSKPSIEELKVKQSKHFINQIGTLKGSFTAHEEMAATLYITDLNKNEIVDKKDIEVTIGENEFELSNIQNTEASSKDYLIELKRQNNAKDLISLHSTISFVEPSSILYLTGDNNPLSTVAGFFGVSEEKILYYNNDTINDIPSTKTALSSFDEIIMNDFDIRELSDKAQTFVENLKYVVENTDTSLVTIGRTYSSMRFSEYSYMQTFDELLPNQSDEKNAIIFLIDVSGSMDTGDRLKKVKLAIRSTIDYLSDEDMVGIVTFSDEAKTVLPLTEVKDNESIIISRLNKIVTEGGTTMGTGLKLASQELKASSIPYKAIITFSDGEPTDTEYALRNVCYNLANNNISCSFINISNSSGASLLRKLARYGNGNYYYANNASSIVDFLPECISDTMVSKTLTNEFSAIPTTTKKDDDVYMRQFPSDLSFAPIPVEDIVYSFKGEIIYTKPGKNDIYTVDWPFYKGSDDGGAEVYTQETLPLLSYYTNDHGSTIFSIHMTLSYMSENCSATNLKSMLTTITYQSLPTITD